jgi:hypothetical protein
VDNPRTPETDEIWRAYLATNPSVTGTYDVVAFGDSA